MIGHSVMVAILATTGRFSLRTIGRAVISLNVRRMPAIVPPYLQSIRFFHANPCRCKFTIEYTFTERGDAAFRHPDARTDSRWGLQALSPAGLQPGYYGRHRRRS